MATNEFTYGTIIYNKGEPVTQISLVAEGEIEGSSGGYNFLFGKTDILGLCDIISGVHSQTYTAISSGSLHSFPCDGVDSFGSMVEKSMDIAYLMASSMCQQISELLQYRLRLKSGAESSLDTINELYAEYGRLSRMYAIQPKKLPGLEAVEKFSFGDPVKDWLHSYYVEISELDPAIHKSFFYGNPGIVAGFIHKSVEDFSQIMLACDVYQEYLGGISSLLLNKDGYDLFSLISGLHLGCLNISGADPAIEALLAQLDDVLSDLPGIDSDYYQSRMDSYWDMLEEKRESHDSSESAGTSSVGQGVNRELLDSLKTILEYSGCEDQLAGDFTQRVNAFTELSDRSSTEDDASDLRRSLTKLFYEVYKLVFIKSLDDPSPPTVIKMFLNFGYVDPALAGYENAGFLYSIADTFKGNPESGIYTISEWLTAIYNEERAPSLSEFDMDFTAYLRDLKNSKQIDAAEEKRLLASRDDKLRYEMENAFPVVNRVTFGNPSKFCPLYADHNLIRSPEDTLVTAAEVKSIIDEIRSIDFSAFYRETAYSDTKLGVTAENINVEVLPNIILMPNAGIRGSMWQEIEGRVRTTPARIFMPVFLEGDLKNLIIRLVGEFRWEMCRRIQGSRWNDLSDPSLTSYFCDYLQFYMNNRSISMQTMNEIRNELSAARNSYKTVFVQNYAVWLLNESRGMARLNSIALGIFMTFCPFTESIRETLKKNMRYNEALTRYGAKRQKRVQRLTLLVRKISQTGKGIPKEISDELEFAKR